jgi:diaminopimelate decarboxylase
MDLQPELWGLNKTGEGHLLIGGCDAVELADEYGTPLYAVNETRLRENYTNFFKAFASRYPHVEVYYSYKTNCIPGVLEVLHNCGAKAEVISGYELWVALRLGIHPDSIVFNGPNKTNEELETAIRNGIKLIIADSLVEIERIDRIAGELGLKANLGIRVCPNVVPKGMNPFTATGSRKSQFGVDLETGEAFTAFKKATGATHIDLLAMHCMIGSGIKDAKAYAKALTKMFKLAGKVKAELGKDIQYLDVGGGYGTPGHYDMTGIDLLLYQVLNKMPSPPQPRTCPSVDDFARVITESVRQGCTQYSLVQPTLILEPGRRITGDGQVLLLRVGGIKERSGIGSLVITDGGMISTSLMLFAEYHKVFVANKMNAVNMRKYNVFGRVCTTADLLYKGIKLPVLDERDVLAVMDTGAYFVSTSSNFAYPRPPVVMVKDGKASVIREREHYDDLISKDVIHSSSVGA